MNKTVITLVLLSIMIVSGANGCPTGEDDVETAALGLDVSFVESAPPISVTVGQNFPIYVDLLNKGGDFINKGDAKVYISGIGTNLEGVKVSLTNERSLAKESVSPDRAVFAETASFTFPIESLYTLPLALTTCYNYGTRTQVSLCVAAKNNSELCEVGSEKITSTSNSVAPIQVTSLKESILGNKYRISFVLENKLGGSVYLPATDCDLLYSKDISESFKQNKVQVEIRTPKQGFSCKLRTATEPYVPIEATSGVADVGTVICEKEISGKENYVTPFSIVLRYKYVDSSLKSINVLP